MRTPDDEHDESLMRGMRGFGRSTSQAVVLDRAIEAALAQPIRSLTEVWTVPPFEPHELEHLPHLLDFEHPAPE